MVSEVYTVTFWSLETVFEEVNKVLFFSQVIEPEMTILKSVHNFSSVLSRDGKVELIVSKTFESEEYFYFRVVAEMVRIYEEAVTGEPCKFDQLFNVYMHHAWNKLGDRMEDLA